MKIIFNPDEKVVSAIRDGLKRKDGYCPCRIQKTEDNVCMCKEFRDQVADPEFEGFCHCRLYYKSKD
jgi:ferredoxin-thioredoxin reductase catalytic subunit